MRCSRNLAWRTGPSTSAVRCARNRRRDRRGPNSSPPSDGEAMRVDNQGVGIEYADEGTGPAVLLLHGWPDSGRLWRHQVRALVGAGFRTIVPDLRGFGQSDAPSE